MTKEFLLPIYEVIFKLLFGDERNKDILTDFLKSVLKVPHEEYDEITISDPHLIREFPDDKLGILDVKLKLKSGRVVNIEIQLATMKAFKQRMMFYNARMITEQIGDSEQYEQINPVVNIVITNHTLIAESNSYHHHFRLADLEKQVIFSDLTEIHTLELPKLSFSQDEKPLMAWMKFFNVKSKEELDMVVQEYPQMQRTATKYLEITQDDRNRAMHEARVKQRRDMQAHFEAMVDAMVGEVEKKSRNEERTSIAKNMLALGLSPEIISQSSGLSIEEIGCIDD